MTTLTNNTDLLTAIPTKSKFMRENVVTDSASMARFDDIVRENALRQGREVQEAGSDHIDYKANKKKSAGQEIANFNFQNWIKIMVASFKYQDPANPKDPGEVVTQLATMGMSVGLTEVRKDMGDINKLFDKSIGHEIGQLMGKDVVVLSNNFKLKTDQNPHFGFNLPQDAKGAIVTISDSQGKVVRNITMEGPIHPGSHAIAWDSKSNNGQLVPAGNYTFKVSALGKNNNQLKNSDGSLVKIKTYVAGTMDGYYRQGGENKIVVDGNVYNANKNFQYGGVYQANQQPNNNYLLQQAVGTFEIMPTAVPVALNPLDASEQGDHHAN